MQTERTIYAVHLSAATRAKDGMLLEHEKDFYGRALERAARRQAARRHDRAAGDGAARAARSADDRSLHRPGDPDGRGGRRLLPRDASATASRASGRTTRRKARTFKGQVGRRVLPDVPLRHRRPDGAQTRAARRSRSTATTRYDDEGVAGAHGDARRQRRAARLPEVAHADRRARCSSNGHGRAEGTADPMGRMANLFVRSTKQVPVAQAEGDAARRGAPPGQAVRPHHPRHHRRLDQHVELRLPGVQGPCRASSTASTPRPARRRSCAASRWSARR